MMRAMRPTLLLGSIFAIGSCQPAIEIYGEDALVEMSQSNSNPAPVLKEPVPIPPRASANPAAVAVVAAPEDSWVNAPFTCETFDVYESAGRYRKGKIVYPSRYKRNRYRLTYADQKRTYALVRMVSDEMDFEPNIPEIHAKHEVSGKPETIHILNNDLSANQSAWEKYSYSRVKEDAIVKRMADLTVHDRKYWVAKEDLRNVRMYQGNKHWRTYLKYTRHIPERGEVPAEEWDESRSVWWFGYGLYGMNAVLYTQVWDSQAPPWVMCSHEGIVATISYVWVARAAKHKCDELSQRDPERYGKDGGSNKGVLRRMAKGRCGKGTLGPKWRGLMKDFEARGVDWDASARVGEKWPQFEMYSNGKPKRDERGNKIPTDRKKILDHMVAKAKKRGLFRTEPLARPEGTEPRLVRRR